MNPPHSQPLPGAPPRTLVEAIRQTIRLHYSSRTEEAYVHRTRAFIAFHDGRHPRTLGAPDATAFLNHLAVDRRVSASTQNQALCALLFLYRRVLDLDLPQVLDLERARRPHHLPAVLSHREVLALLDRLEPPFRLLAELLYGSGLRLLEALAIRVKDVDLERHQIMVRRGKGQRDRAALLPTRAQEGLRAQMEAVAVLHRAERAAGRGLVDLPDALHRKMPETASSLAWQYLFPASRPCLDPATGAQVLRHLHESVLQKAVTAAAREAGIDKRATCHTLAPPSALVSDREAGARRPRRLAPPLPPPEPSLLLKGKRRNAAPPMHRAAGSRMESAS